MLGGCLALMVRVCRRQSGKAGEPCQGPWALVEPRDNAVDIDRGSDRDVLHMGLRQATISGRLPCPPPCSHHATARWPWGQRTCCRCQSTSNCSRVYAPSTCVCHPWLGRVGPRRMMLCSSRLLTSNSELIYAVYAAST